MPYCEHQDCKPLNDDLCIWRYMDFAKFISLISSNTLYFVRADRFDDPWEGVPQKAILDELVKHFAQTIKWSKEKTHDHFRNIIIPQRFISCWHLNENESAAMWTLYGKTKEAIAIKTTIGRLKASLCKEPEKFYLDQVKYGKHDDFQLPADIKDGPVDKWTCPFFFKRDSFEYEKEIRVVITFRKTAEEYKAKVDISKLVEKLYVSPQSGQWFVETVKSTLQKYGYDCIEVMHSCIDDERIL